MKNSAKILCLLVYFPLHGSISPSQTPPPPCQVVVVAAGSPRGLYSPYLAPVTLPHPQPREPEVMLPVSVPIHGSWGPRGNIICPCSNFRGLPHLSMAWLGAGVSRHKVGSQISGVSDCFHPVEEFGGEGNHFRCRVLCAVRRPPGCNHTAPPGDKPHLVTVSVQAEDEKQITVTERGRVSVTAF